MERKLINDSDLQNVVGGSIMLNEDCTTCGRNCTDQYKVLDLDAIIKYYNDNKNKMPEKKMMTEMEKLGYIVSM